MHIGNKINLLIHSDKKYSKKDLAKYLNKTRQAVYDIIKNPDINTRTLRKIAKYFNVDIAFFIDDSTNLQVTQMIHEGSNLYGAQKKYLEDRMENVERRLSKLENSLRSDS